MSFVFKQRAIPKTNNNIFIKLISILSAVFLCILSGVGCASRPSICAPEVLLAMTAAGSSHPVGDAYILPSSTVPDAAESEKQPDGQIWRIADSSLLHAAFGNESSTENNEISELSQGIVDSGAMFLSTAHVPCEYMVFHCISRSDTDMVVELLLRRLDVLRQQYRDTEHQATIENARILVLDKYVIFAVAQSADDAIDAACRAINKS